MAAWKMRRMERVGRVTLWGRLVSQQRDEIIFDVFCFFLFFFLEIVFEARPLDWGVFFYICIYIYNYELCQLFQIQFRSDQLM